MKYPKFSEKEKKSRDFAEAIACETEIKESVLKRFSNVNEMVVDESYIGPRIIDNKITLEFIVEMLEWLKNQKCLHLKYALQIMTAANNLFLAQCSITDVIIPEDAKLTVCGDIHGQFYDVLNVFKLNGNFIS